MNTQEKIAKNLTSAFKAGESEKTGVLRLLTAAIQNKEIEKRGKGEEVKLAEEEIIQLLTTEAKKRKEAITMYEEGNRSELAEKEKDELKIIQAYLPEQMSAEKVIEEVDKIIEKSSATDFGSAMKEVMGILKGKADARAISEAVRNKFQN